MEVRQPRSAPEWHLPSGRDLARNSNIKGVNTRSRVGETRGSGAPRLSLSGEVVDPRRSVRHIPLVPGAVRRVVRRFEALYRGRLGERYGGHPARDERAARRFLACSAGDVEFALERVDDAFAHSLCAREERRFDLLEAFALDFARVFRPTGGALRRRRSEASKKRAHAHRGAA